MAAPGSLQSDAEEKGKKNNKTKQEEADTSASVCIYNDRGIRLSQDKVCTHMRTKPIVFPICYSEVLC